MREAVLTGDYGYRCLKAQIPKRTFLCLFFSLCALVSLPVEELILGMDFQTSPLNYLAILLACLFIVSCPIGLNKQIVGVFATILSVLIINNLFAPHASNKWYFNQVGFLVCSLIISSAYANINDEEAEKIKRFLIRTGTAGFVVLTLCVLYMILNYHYLVIDAVRLWQFNSVIYQLVPSLSWEKQSLGNFAALIFAIIFVLKRRQTPLFFLLCLPILAGIRTFWLGIACTLLFVQIKKKHHLLLAFPCALVLALAVAGNYQKFSTGFFDFRHRIAAYSNGYHIVKTMPFGIGLGQYHNYVPDLGINRVRYRYDIVATAPESDIVLVFGSLGLCPGLIFYSIHVWLLIKLRKMYYRLSNVDRFFSFSFFLFMFSGLSQDNMFELPHWISLGFALGAAMSGRYA